MYINKGIFEKLGTLNSKIDLFNFGISDLQIAVIGGNHGYG